MSAVDGSPRTSLRAERAAETRRRIAASARRLFSGQGYGATRLTEIATDAGVAVQTIYAVYGSKAAILAELRESVVRQPEAGELFARAMEEPDPGLRLDLFAASIRERWERGHDIVAINNDAATTDPAIRADVEQVLATRRAGIRRLADTLAGHLAAGVTVERAFALLDAMTLPEVYAELVVLHGWSPPDFEAWLATTLRLLLLRQSAKAHASDGPLVRT